MIKIKIEDLEDVIASVEAEAKKQIDNAEQELTCPKCGHKFRKTIGELKRHRAFNCPACGESIGIDGLK